MLCVSFGRALSATAATEGKAGVAAAAAVRVNVVVSYLRLLTALVTRAPTPEEAFVRGRSLLLALVRAIETHARVLRGQDTVASSSTRTGVSSVGVKVRSASTDSAVLCMQTLKFLLDWTEQQPSSVGGKSLPIGAGAGVSTASGSSSNVGGGVNRPVGSSSAAATSAAAAAGATSAPTVKRATELASSAAATRTIRSGAAGSGAGVTARFGDAPTCLHGLRTRLSNGGESGAGAEAVPPSAVCYVCPLVDRARRCEFVQVVDRLEADDYSGARNKASPTAGAAAGGRFGSPSLVKGAHRQGATSSAPAGGKGNVSAVVVREAAVRKAVGRACQDVLADAFSSCVPVSEERAGPVVSASWAGAGGASETRGDGSADMHVEGDTAAATVPSDRETAAAEAATLSRAIPGDLPNMQVILCSLLQMALVVAGSPAAAAAAEVAGSGAGAAAAAAAEAAAAATAASAEGASAAPITSATASSDPTSEAAASPAPGAASSAPPMLLIARHWEDTEDPDEEEVGMSEVAPAGSRGSGADSDSAAAAAVVAAVVGSGGVSRSLPRPPSSSGVTSGSTVASAGTDPCSPELLQALIAGLLGGGVDAGRRSTGGTSRSVPRRGSAKDKDGGVKPGTSGSHQGKSNASSKSPRTVAADGEEGGKKRARGGGSGSGGGDGAAVATVTMSATKVAGQTTKAAFWTPAEGLTRLNAVLRGPSLAVLASTLQLATVSLFVCLFCSVFRGPHVLLLLVWAKLGLERCSIRA